MGALNNISAPTVGNDSSAVNMELKSHQTASTGANQYQQFLEQGDNMNDMGKIFHPSSKNDSFIEKQPHLTMPTNNSVNSTLNT